MLHISAVNTSGSGAIDTPMVAPLKERLGAMKRRSQRSWVGGMGQPEETADGAIDLASDATDVRESRCSGNGGLMRQSGSQ